MGNSTAPDNHESDLGIDFLKIDYRFFLITLKRRIIYILGIALAGLAIATVTAKLTIKTRWSAQCTLLRNTSQAFEQKDLPQLYKPLDLNTMVETIRTRQNVEAVIKKLKLSSSVQALYGQTAILKDKNTSIIRIVATANSPHLAADIANTLTDVFLQQYVEILSSSAKKVYEYYQVNRDEITRRITEQEKKLSDFKARHRIISMESQTAVQFEQLKTAEVKLMENTMLEEALRIKIDDTGRNIGTMKKEVQLSYVVSADAQKNIQAMEAELAQLKQKFTARNPRVQRVEAELEAARKAPQTTTPVPEKIVYGDNELRRVQEQEKLAAETSLKSTHRNSEELRNEITRLKGELSKLSALETEYMEILRKLAIDRELLKSVENILTLSQAAIKATTIDVEVLERAVPPPSHIAGRKKIIAIAGGIFGLILGTLLFALLEFLDFTVKSKYDFVHLAGIPVIGELPDKDAVEPSRYFAALQMLYDQILSRCQGHPTPYVSCGGSDPEAGKSFIINGLCEFACTQKRRVLAIDTVMQPPAEIAPFLINRFLYDETDDRPAVNPINAYWDKAYFDFNQQTYMRPLDSRRVKALFESFHGYEIVFFELPTPYHNLQLFAAFAGSADLTIIVGRFRHSNKFKLKKCIDFLHAKQINNLAGVVNRVELPYYDNPS